MLVRSSLTPVMLNRGLSAFCVSIKNAISVLAGGRRCSVLCWLILYMVLPERKMQRECVLNSDNPKIHKFLIGLKCRFYFMLTFVSEELHNL